ncbi:MAG: division/cell wall cluster transcriptional repressor MraZ [Limisphaerales bacterium]
MSENGTNEPQYLSRYEHGVDEKRRLQIPSKWRSEDPNLVYTVIYWSKGALQPPCLLVLPPTAMKRLMGKIAEMSFSDPKAEALRRFLGANSDTVTPDKSGRVCLPDEMAKKAGIGEKAILIGMFDRFQIWSPENYNAVNVIDDAHSMEALALI